MTQYAIATDLNRCVGCLACSVTCKVVNDVPIGSYWNKVLRIGPNPKFEGAEFPDVEMYFLTVQCQHCADPECVKVCPTGVPRTSWRTEPCRSTESKCIGCQFCAMSCPYGGAVFERGARGGEVPLCEGRRLPRASCRSASRNVAAVPCYFGDLEQGIAGFGFGSIDSFKGTSDYDATVQESREVDRRDRNRMPKAMCIACRTWGTTRASCVHPAQSYVARRR